MPYMGEAKIVKDLSKVLCVWWVLGSRRSKDDQKLKRMRANRCSEKFTLRFLYQRSLNFEPEIFTELHPHTKKLLNNYEKSP